MNHRIQRFTVDGEYLGGWGGYGAQAGQFNTPWRMACDADGNVFVADWRNDRVQAFTPEGRFVGQWGVSGDGKGQLNRPSSVAVDEDGYIYVADWGNERVQIFAPDGEVAAISARRRHHVVVGRGLPRRQPRRVGRPSHRRSGAHRQPVAGSPPGNLGRRGKILLGAYLGQPRF